MKITYIVQYYPPHPGGLELVAQRQAQGAVAKGHEASVVTFALPGAKVGDSDEDGIHVSRVRGIHYFDKHFGIPFCLGGISMFRALRREVANADVVHMHDVFYMTSWVAYALSRWYKKPVVLTQHVAMVKHSSKAVMLVEKAVYSLFGMRIFKNCHTIIVYNKIVRGFLVDLKIPASKILEVKNGIDIDRFHTVDTQTRAERRRALGLPVDKMLALFVGRLVPKKGYKELYNARDNDYDIVFVGPGTVPEGWHDTPGVHVLGERTQKELANLYPIVDMFVSPTHGELFTLVMQEAFASGVPVITTDEPAYKEYDIDRSNIVLCKPTATELKHEMKRLVADDALRARMGGYSRRLAEQWFDWRENIHPTIDLYEQITKEKK